jgi:AraC-like DNA-binding protein
MGRTFVEILNQYRSDRAAQSLLMTDLPIIDVSTECGFRDQSYFGKVFRSYDGVSPGRYRKENTN